MKESNRGYVAMLLSYLLWGNYPIYFKQLEDVPSFEVLAHRIVWSCIVSVLMTVALGYKKDVIAVFKNKKMVLTIFLSSIAVALNWFTFIYGIAIGDILQTSLGYFISPIVSFAFSILIFKEKLSTSKKIAILVTFFAVLLEIFRLGEISFIAIGIALSWSIYGSIKKSIKKINSIVSVSIEVIFLTPFALIYLLYLNSIGNQSFLQSGIYIDTFLVLTGVVTLTPMFLFSYSASKVPLNFAAFTQYIVPTMSFLIAIYMYNEPLNSAKLTTFILIWIALLIFSFDSVKGLIFNKR